MTAIIPGPELQIVALDLYRDVHKGIRSELFATTTEAGRLDAAQLGDRAALAGHVHSTIELLVAHAEHEDTGIQPALNEHLPTLAAQLQSEHQTLETRLHGLGALSDAAVDAPVATQRQEIHHLYLELASFTAAYLAHQDLEERVVMPALEAAIGVDAVAGIHQAIIARIPPDRLARFLRIMLPAMNVDDRTDLLGGMQADAPTDAFQGICVLARLVLSPADHSAVAKRLGIR